MPHATAPLSSPLQWPMVNPQIVQGFGITEFARAHPDFYRNGEHLAIDLDVTFAAPVFSAANGIVIAKGKEACPNFSFPECNFGYGNWLLIWHNDLNLATDYQHLTERPTLEVGDVVNEGDVIGHQGASGKVHGSHLHFAVFEGPVTVIETRNNNIDFQILSRESVKNPLTVLPELKTISENE